MVVELVGALLGWLTQEAGSHAVRGGRRLLLGDAQHQALRTVVADAVGGTVAEAGLGDEDAAHLRAVLLERGGAPEGLGMGTAGLRAALGVWIAALDRPELGGPGYLSALGVDADWLANRLAVRIEAGIQADARAGGALGTVAEWVWRDGTTARLARIQTALGVAVEPSQPSATLARDLFVQAQRLPRRPPPSFLLRSGYGIVPFRGRERELADFVAWCKQEDDVGVRLCLAPGGQGKTRFAQLLIRHLAGCDWVAGRLRSHWVEESLLDPFSA